MNSPAKVFLLSLNCSEALAVIAPMRKDAVLTAELIGGARCESLPRGGCKCCEEVGECAGLCLGAPTEQHPRGCKHERERRGGLGFPMGLGVLN